MTFNQLTQRINSHNYNGRLVAIYRKKELFGISELYASGKTRIELSNKITESILKKGRKGVFQIVEL